VFLSQWRFWFKVGTWLVNPYAKLRSVGYPVEVTVTAPNGTVLREGLTGTARIVLSEERNVLMVPVNAVRGTFDRPFVRIVQGSRVIERQVVLGDSDGLPGEEAGFVTGCEALGFPRCDDHNEPGTTGVGPRTLAELTARICAVLNCPHEPYLSLTEEVA
jgi:hypothetical protein